MLQIEINNTMALSYKNSRHVIEVNPILLKKKIFHRYFKVRYQLEDLICFLIDEGYLKKTVGAGGCFYRFRANNKECGLILVVKDGTRGENLLIKVEYFSLIEDEYCQKINKLIKPENMFTLDSYEYTYIIKPRYRDVYMNEFHTPRGRFEIYGSKHLIENSSGVFDCFNFDKLLKEIVEFIVEKNILDTHSNSKPFGIHLSDIGCEHQYIFSLSLLSYVGSQETEHVLLVDSVVSGDLLEEKMVKNREKGEINYNFNNKSLKGVA